MCSESELKLKPVTLEGYLEIIGSQSLVNLQCKRGSEDNPSMRYWFVSFHFTGLVPFFRDILGLGSGFGSMSTCPECKTEALK